MGLRKRAISVLGVGALALTLYVNAQTSLENMPTDNKTDSTIINKSKKQLKKEASFDLIMPHTYTMVNDIKLKQGTKLTVIAEQKKSEFWKTVKEGAEQAIKDINKELGNKKIKFEFSASKINDIEDQVNLLDVVMGDNPDAIGLAVVDEDAFETQFDLATENGIDVVSCGTGGTNGNIQAQVGTDGVEIGKEQAQKISEVLKGKGSFVSVYKNNITQYDRDREKGLREGIANKKELKLLHTGHLNIINDEIKVNDRFTCNEDVKAREKQDAEVAKAKAEKEAREKEAKEKGIELKEETDDTKVEKVEVTKKTLEDLIVQSIIEDKSLRLISCGDCYATSEVIKALDNISDESSEALEYVEDKNKRKQISEISKKISIVGFVGEGKSVNAIKEGRLVKACVENPYGIGYATVVAEARAEAKLGNNAIIDSGHKWIEKKDLKNKEIKGLLDL